MPSEQALRYARAVLAQVRDERNDLRRKVVDYYTDSVVLDLFDWDIDPWDRFLWGP